MQTPPGGWNFTVPSSMSERLAGYTIQARSVGDLREKASLLFLQNGETWNERMFEDVVCNSLPDTWCLSCGDEKNPWAEERPLNEKKILAFFLTMLRWMREGMRFVDKETAVRRYAVCRNCPQSTRVLPPGVEGKCAACSVERAARKTIMELVSKQGNVTENETEEERKNPLYCRVCGCQLNAKVWFRIKSKCWSEVDKTESQ